MELIWTNEVMNNIEDAGFNNIVLKPQSKVKYGFHAKINDLWFYFGAYSSTKDFNNTHESTLFNVKNGTLVAVESKFRPGWCILESSL